ncbi:MAG: hypothetical protein RIB60_01145 [Phycisphaerales bacterium]
MDDIRRVIDAAGRRLLFNDWLARLTVLLTVVLGVAFAARVGQKLVPFDVPWATAWLIGAGVALVLAGVWAIAARKKELEIAQHVDERAGLRESLSTALVVAKAQDGWSRNVVESAGERAKRVVVRDTVPITAPRLWAMPAALLLALAAVWWLPSYDVTGMFAEREQAEEQQREIQEVRAEAQAAEEKIQELMSKAGMEVDDEGEAADEQPEIDPNAPITPEDVRREAIKKLTNLADQLDEKLNESEEAKALEALNRSMRQLKTPGEGPGSEMAKQMARGNYEQAQQELEKLAEQIASGEMSEEQKQQLAKNLEAMSEQLRELADQRQQLEEQLQAAGYSAEQAQQMARDPSQMQQQLQQNQDLSQEQKQQLQQQAQAQQRASDSMNGACNAMSQMAQGLQNPSQQGGQQSMDGAQAMGQQLSQMEMMQAEMQSAQMAMSEAQAQLQRMGQGMCEGSSPGQGQGMNGAWRMGESTAMGSGSGGPGRGNGFGPEAQATDYMVRKEKANVNTGEGPVIASTLVHGAQIRGESKQTFSAVATSARAEAAEAIEHSRVPRRHESAVQHYFGRLEQAGSDSDAEGTEP